MEMVLWDSVYNNDIVGSFFAHVGFLLLYRLYTIEVTATDLAGNQAMAVCMVKVIQHNTNVEDYPYVLFVFAVLIPEVIVLAFEIVLEQADYHDALIDGAEIEALYENTRQMLNASAAIYDEVVCRCIDDLESRPQSKFMSFSCVLSMVE
jgi:hypothetical protein